MIINSSRFLEYKEVTDLEALKEDLKINNPEYATFVKYVNRGKKPAKFLEFFKEDSLGVVVPRNYTRYQIPISTSYELSEGTKQDFKFLGTLREYQDPYAKEVIEDGKTDSILLMPCGHGKTLLAIYLTAARQTTTLILVPTKKLADQWKERCEVFLANARVGIATSDKDINKEYNKYNIYIINLSLITIRDLDINFYNFFGQVILDEGHRLGAPTYQPLLDKLSSKYRLALSATFRRTDGMHRVLQYHFGQHYVMRQQFAPAHIIPFLTGRKYNEESFTIRGTVQFTLLDNLVSEDATRTKMLLSLIINCVKMGRKPLFLSKRRRNLELFHTACIGRGIKSHIVVGKKGSKGLEGFPLEEAEVVFGIMQLAQEGLDIESVDTLILEHPLKDPEQAVGRILRVAKGKRNPLVLWPLDDVKPYKGVFEASKKWVGESAEYKKITTYETLLNKLIEHGEKTD